MALNITRTFANATNALGSWLDDNFTLIQNFINNSLDATVVKDSAKCGGYAPSGTPIAGEIPVIDTLSELVIPRVVGASSIITLTSNAKYDGADWRFRQTGYAIRVDFDISTYAAPKYYTSTASGVVDGVITWAAGLDFVLGSAAAVTQANTLLEAVSGLYRQASKTPSADQILALNSDANIDMLTGQGEILLYNSRAIKGRNVENTINYDLIYMDSTNNLVLGTAAIPVKVLGASLKVQGNTVWHEGNDGPTSGLAAQSAAIASTINGWSVYSARVDSAGNLSNALGVTASNRTGVGTFTVDFPSLPNNINAVATVAGLAGTGYSCTVIYTSSTRVTVEVWNHTAGGLYDGAFGIIITGN